MLACFLSCLGAVLSCCHQTKHLKEESSFKVQPFHEVRIAQASITAALKANARKICVSASLNPASVVAVPPPGIKHGFLLYFDAQDANLMSDNEEQSEAEPTKLRIGDAGIVGHEQRNKAVSAFGRRGGYQPHILLFRRSLLVVRVKANMVGLPETNDILSDAWNYKGRPAVRSRTGGWSGAAMILGMYPNLNLWPLAVSVNLLLLNERLTTLGIAVNLVTYLTGTMHLGNAASANTVTNFMGTSFMLCLLGGFVADSFLGRYLTIVIFAAVQASVSTTATSISKPLSSSATGLSTVFDGIDMQGVSILTISTAVPGLRPPACTDLASGGCVKASGAQLGVLYLALYLTALGTGGLKSSVSGFGSDQFDETDHGEKAQMMKFFNWFFFFISLGSLLAVTVLVYIQDNLGREWGYGLCATAIALGLVVFLSGTWRYRFKKLVGSPLTQIAVVVAAAWRKRGLELPSDPSLLHDIDERQAATDAEKGSKRSNAKQRVPHTKQFRYALNSSLLSCCRHLVPTFPLIMVSYD
ncbi:hypothetical protein B296_00013895 [Ensete ventricosum]|uniref:Major facilitator superfamily (MFS) profile domain-containing protein n=1 Tax=Ensete ventricosum TaxID=4639 RepID=A0A427AXM5_ENSVE|nr:hypothetical protein B296_00013895 [Ensete ventricosum]